MLTEKKEEDCMSMTGGLVFGAVKNATNVLQRHFEWMTAE